MLVASLISEVRVVSKSGSGLVEVALVVRKCSRKVSKKVLSHCRLESVSELKYFEVNYVIDSNFNTYRRAEA